MYMCICMHAMCVCVCVRACMHACMHACVCVHAGMHVCMYVFVGGLVNGSYEICCFSLCKNKNEQKRIHTDKAVLLRESMVECLYTYHNP